MFTSTSEKLFTINPFHVTPTPTPYQAPQAIIHVSFYYALTILTILYTLYTYSNRFIIRKVHSRGYTYQSIYSAVVHIDSNRFTVKTLNKNCQARGNTFVNISKLCITIVNLLLLYRSRADKTNSSYHGDAEAMRDNTRNNAILGYYF